MNNNRIVYISSAVSEKLKTKYFKDKMGYFPHQAQKFNKLLIRGFKDSGEAIESLSIPPINRKITRKLIVSKNVEIENDIKFESVPFINLKIVRNICIFLYIFIKILRYESKSIIIIDLLNRSAVSAAALARVFKKHFIIGILTDLPSFKTNQKNEVSKLGYLHKITYNKFDHFILLTKYMVSLHKKFEKHHSIIEGISDEHNLILDIKKYSKKTCMYTGTLARVYGIDNLVSAFTKDKLSDIQLVIYGEGDYKDALIEISKMYPNIQYKGSASNDEIIKEQSKVHLLINPRPVEGVFTRYSFPSKIIEYLSSGTPTVTTNLQGIPDDYRDFLYILENSDSDGIANFVSDFFQNKMIKSSIIGKEAKEFVLKYKNGIWQANKIRELLKNNNII